MRSRSRPSTLFAITLLVAALAACSGAAISPQAPASEAPATTSFTAPAGADSVNPLPPPAPDPGQPNASNGWIAYSTAPADYDGPIGDPRPLVGSDIYLVREGEEPRLIASRGDGMTWNVCPAFSPGGRMLAFGEATRSGRAIVVLGIDASGSVTEASLRLPVLGTGRAPCPRWSADGARVAYLDAGGVVVRELDGSAPALADGDPRVADFTQSNESLPSPSGDLIVSLQGCQLVVTPADGPKMVVGRGGCYYALGTRSPDGRKVLSMEDVSGRHFTMHATSVVEPFETTTIVEGVEVNHGRSWPGNGDVSWQPVFAAMKSP